MQFPSSSSVHTTPPGLVRAIAWAGLIAGTLDMTSAVLVSGASLFRICQYIASAVIGNEAAFSGGYWTALLGLLFHYSIAYSWTVLYFILYPRISFLSKQRIISGLLYGVVVWVVMNRVVVPLSRIQQGPFNLVHAAKNMAILMVMIGLPVSWLAHRFYSRR